MGRSRVLAIALLCALAFSLRIALYCAPPPELLPDARAAWEEIHRGTTAREFLRGPLLAPIDYQINGYWGGSLVVSLLAVPLYAVFGPQLLVLRATTFLFSGIGIAALFVLLDRFHGRHAAWIGGALYALAPPGFALSGACAWGTHVEGHALALLMCALVMRRDAQRWRLGAELALGAMMGFCVYFGRSLALTVAVLAWHERFVVRTLASGRARAARGVGFAAGLLPLFVLLLLRGPAALALDSQDAQLGLNGPVQLARSAAHLVWKDLPAALFFPDWGPIGGEAIGRFYVMVLAGSALVLFVRERGTLLRFVRRISSGAAARESSLVSIAAVHLAVFACVYVIGAYDARARAELFQLRYALWPFPWLVLAAAASTSGLRRGGRASTLAAALAMVLVSVAGTGLRMDRTRAGELLDAPGFSDAELGRFVLRRSEDRPATLDGAIERLLERADTGEQRTILSSMGRYLGGLLRLRESADPALGRLSEIGARQLAQLEAALPAPLARLVRKQAGIPDEAGDFRDAKRPGGGH